MARLDGIKNISLGLFVWILMMRLPGEKVENGPCCQGLENPLLMHWAKAERDSKSDGGEEGVSHKMTEGEVLQRQCIVLLCVSMGSCDCKMGWNKWNGARSPPTKHHYKQLHKYYAFGITSGGWGHESHGMQPLPLGGHGCACTLMWFRGFSFRHKLSSLSWVCTDFCFDPLQLRKPLKAQNITRQLS